MVIFGSLKTAVSEQILGLFRPRQPRRTAPVSPYLHNSSPQVIRLVVMMYVRYPLSLRNAPVICWLQARHIQINH